MLIMYLHVGVRKAIVTLVIMAVQREHENVVLIMFTYEILQTDSILTVISSIFQLPNLPQI